MTATRAHQGSQVLVKSIRCTVLVLSYFPFGPGNRYSLLLSLILFPCDMVGTFLRCHFDIYYFLPFYSMLEAIPCTRIKTLPLEPKVGKI